MRPYLSSAAEAACSAIILRGSTFEPGGKQTPLSADTLAPYRAEVCFHSIASWNLTDENEQLLPLEPEPAKRASIAKLPGSILDQVLAEVNAASKGRAPREAVEFRPAA